MTVQRALYAVAATIALGLALAASGAAQPPGSGTFDRRIRTHAETLWERGRAIFRFDTFGDEAFWGGALKLHQAIAGERTAASGRASARARRSAVGLKVDVDALPPALVAAIARRRRSTSTIPATTLALLDAERRRRRDAASSTPDGRARSRSASSARSATRRSTTRSRRASATGSTAGRTATSNVGAIVALAPDLSAVRRAARRRRGDGAHGARQLGPGQVRRRAVPRRQGVPARRQDRGDADSRRRSASPASTCTPTPAGASVTYWNAFVANLEMHGKGTFFDPRLDDATQVPGRGARPASATSRSDPDLITPQAAGAAVLPARDPGADAAARAASTRRAAERGKAVFDGQGAVRDVPRAAALHRARLEHAHGRRRSASTTSRPTARPTALSHDAARRACSPRQKGGFYHDGRFADAAGRSSSTTTATSRSVSARTQKTRARRVPEVAVDMVRWGISHGQAGSRQITRVTVVASSRSPPESSAARKSQSNSTSPPMRNTR